MPPPVRARGARPTRDRDEDTTCTMLGSRCVGPLDTWNQGVLCAGSHEYEHCPNGLTNTDGYFGKPSVTIYCNKSIMRQKTYNVVNYNNVDYVIFCKSKSKKILFIVGTL